MQHILTVYKAGVNSRDCFTLNGTNSAHMAHSAFALLRNPALAGGTAVLEATAVWGAKAVRHNSVFVADTAVFRTPLVWGTTALWAPAAQRARRRCGGITAVWGTGGCSIVDGLAVLTAGEN